MINKQYLSFIKKHVPVLSIDAHGSDSLSTWIKRVDPQDKKSEKNEILMINKLYFSIILPSKRCMKNKDWQIAEGDRLHHISVSARVGY